jgi:UPF0176 protein
VTEVSIAAAYRFVPLADVPALRLRLERSAAEARLKGTLLLAEEGLNFTLAGAPAALDAWLQALQADPRFADLPLKRSRAAALPFGHLRVKHKAEIIRMNQPTVQPHAGRAPAVGPATLRRWLDDGRCDAGRPVRLLDTRNAFEVDAGGFVGALDWRLARFSDFPAALQAHRGELQGATVVSYCTGGIRCEKAALWMAQAGVAHALQLDGGILGYFDQTDGAPHWRGHCVVFDERQAVSPSGQPLAGALRPGPAAAAVPAPAPAPTAADARQPPA